MTCALWVLSGTPGTAMPAAQSIAANTSDEEPRPHLPSARIGSTCTLRPAPAMPMPLLVCAPTRLSVCVPCHELDSPW